MSELWVLIKYQTVMTATMPRIVTAVALPRSSHLGKHTRGRSRARAHTHMAIRIHARAMQTRTKTDRGEDARMSTHALVRQWQWLRAELTCCRTWP